ncbi:MAG: hypothetical protein J2O47_02195 [Acidimicrobiaceae bacterium]|nr:hypothetical protein [Acidimicrobiaceae bacterium]
MAAAIGLLASPASGAPTPSCGITWGSLAKASGHGPGFPPTPLAAVRAGQHPCYDRLVFELDGTPAGYNIHYGSVVTQGRGLPLSLQGGPSLNIVLYAPAYNVDGVPTYNPANPAQIVNVSGFRTFRQVAYGGSFEGYTTIGLGVRARLPFRVFALSGPGYHSRVVVDVAHQW